MIRHVVIELREGEVTGIGHPDDVEVIVIDWDAGADEGNWSYDRVASLIEQVLATDMDGPTQMRLISRLCAKFDEVYGDAVEDAAEKRYERE